MLTLLSVENSNTIRPTKWTISPLPMIHQNFDQQETKIEIKLVADILEGRASQMNDPEGNRFGQTEN